jgi:Family of unknown function (DUF6459)
MPSPTLTPDQSAAPGPDTPPAADQDFRGEPPAWSGLRLITVPAGWPPYDCQTHGAACPAASGATADDSYGGSHAPEPARRPGSASPPEPVTPPTPATPMAAIALPAPIMLSNPAGLSGPAGPPGPGAAWPRQFAQVIVEILAGSRPSRQIVPWTTDRVRARVDGLTRLFTPDQRPRLRCVMTSQPAVSVVEMTMVVGFGPRSRALALRFEHRPERPASPGRPARPARWLCTEIEAG